MNSTASLSSESASESHGHLLVPGELDLSHGVALYLEDINVSFDGFKAINHLSLSIDAGELRCIIGPNGAGIVNAAKSWFTMSFPEYWLYFLGLIFVLVTLFLPQGVMGLFSKWKRAR